MTWRDQAACLDGVFRMLWPVVEPMPFDDLVDEASAEVPTLCRRAGVELLTRPRWSMRRGSDVPGSGGAHIVLVAEAPARVVCRRVVEREAA